MVGQDEITSRALDQSQRLAWIEATLLHCVPSWQLASLCYRTSCDTERLREAALDKRKRSPASSLGERISAIEATLPHLATQSEFVSLGGKLRHLQEGNYIEGCLATYGPDDLELRVAAIEQMLPNLVTKAALERARGYRRARRLMFWRPMPGDNPRGKSLISPVDFLLMFFGPLLAMLVILLATASLAAK